MSLRSPTSREYAVVAAVNAAVAIGLALRHAWAAAYFGILALAAIGCALRARSSGS